MRARHDRRTGSRSRPTREARCRPARSCASSPMSRAGRSHRLDKEFRFHWHVVGPVLHDEQVIDGRAHFDFDTTGRTPGAYTVHAELLPHTPTPDRRDTSVAQAPTPQAPTGVGMPAAVRADAARPTALAARQGGERPDRVPQWNVEVRPAAAVNPEGVLPVSLQRTQSESTPDQVLWTLIRNRTEAISLPALPGVHRRRDVPRAGRAQPRAHRDTSLNFTGTQAYQVLKQATDAFLMQECGVVDADGDCVSPVGFLDPDLMEERAGRIRPSARRVPRARRRAATAGRAPRSRWTQLKTLRRQLLRGPRRATNNVAAAVPADHQGHG